MAYRLRFGGYDFASTLRPAGETSANDLASQERPRAEGASSQLGRRQATSLTIRGDLTAADADTLDTLHRALKAAVYAGKQELWHGRDDRYYRDAQLKSFTTDYQEGLTFGLVASYSLSFEANDYPLAFGATPQTAALAAGSNTVTTVGDASALPAWTITINGAGSGPISLTNATTGESCQLVGTFAAGDVIVLTRDGYTVTRNGTAEFGLLSGRIPTLAAGANTITLSAGGTATITSGSVTYTPRYF